MLQHACSEAFFPGHDAVTQDYWEYIWWRAGHRLASAMLNNFATQVTSMLMGVMTATFKWGGEFPQA